MGRQLSWHSELGQVGVFVDKRERVWHSARDALAGAFVGLLDISSLGEQACRLVAGAATRFRATVDPRDPLERPVGFDRLYAYSTRGGTDSADLK